MNKFYRGSCESSIVGRITWFLFFLRIISVDQTLMIVSLLSSLLLFLFI